MKPALIIQTVCFLGISLGQMSHAATISNVSFEDGGGSFAPWTTTNGSAFVAGTSGSVAPTEGAFQAVISSPQAATVVKSTLLSFLDLSSTALNSLQTGNGSTTGGTAIRQTFDVAEGDVLRFDWHLKLTGASLEGDKGFFTMHEFGTQPASVTVLAGGGEASGTFTSAPLAAGTYLLGFATFDNPTDFSGNFSRPTLYIDNVSVPEPASLGLLGSGLLMLGSRLARRRRS